MWAALERAPLRVVPPGIVLGLDWPAALALAEAFGAECGLAAEFLAAGEDGLLDALKGEAEDLTP